MVSPVFPGRTIMRKFLWSIAALLAGCATTPDQLIQRQVAYYTPVCQKLGYTAHDEIDKCVLHKINENEYFWASTQDVTNESGAVRSLPPLPPPAPQKTQ
jgi:hypothetical protein